MHAGCNKGSRIRGTFASDDECLRTAVFSHTLDSDFSP